MATGAAQPNQPAASASDADRFIEQQLEKTRFQVRVVDLASSLMALVTAILGYSLVLTVVDHWIMPLAWWGRWLACFALLGAVGYYLASVIVPLMLRPINPIYAARAIEESDPSLKNSLINFLLFRNDHASLHRLVFSAMEQRAAADLHRVTIEHAIDRSKVIHFGYLLAGVLTVCAAYTIFSPKDPLQSVSRVVAPWADIERPTRIQINDVQPGDAIVFQGDTVEVSCSLVGTTDTVTLFFSTLDGEIVERAVDMQLAPDGLRLRCKLPPGDGGFQQSISYRIEAGDAKSPTYRVEVSPAPHIAVRELEYDFPSYTKRPKQTDEGQADIKALEGTRVTIHAKANQPIRSAFIELGESQGKMLRRPMEHREQEAWQTITLELQADRKTPIYSSYRLQFVTDAGRESADPILHRIEVLPDLSPEVSILTPTQEVTEVPQDGSQTIEVRAIDPDFGVTAVRLHLVMGGTTLIEKALLQDQQGVEGQTVHSYEFRPHLLGLQPGDRVVYRASAEDNRAAVGSNSPEPNQARTKDYQLLVVPPHKTPANSDGGSTTDQQPTQPRNNESSGARESSETPEGEQPKSGGPESSEEAQSGGDESQEGLSGAAAQGSSTEESDQGSGESESQSQAGQDGASGGQSQAGQSGGGEQAGGDTGQQEGEAGSESGRGEPQGPSEPLHDGEVFERALERMRQQAKDTGQQGKGQSSEGEPQGNSNDQGVGPKTTGGNESPTKGASHGESTNGASEDKQPNGDAKDSSQQQSDPPSPGKGSQHQDNNLGAGEQHQGATGKGGTSKKAGQPTGKNGAEPDDGDERTPSGPKDMREKDPGSGDSGDSGAGQNSKDTTGSGSVESGKPEERVENRDRPKSTQPNSTEPQDNADPGFTKDKKQSDSQGESSGDRSGGGQKGPGQGANQAGNDSAGQNSAADEGAGAATESGTGETSSASGDKQRGEGETGSTGNEKGNGSSSRSDPSGDGTGSGKQPPTGNEQPDSATEKDPAGSESGTKQGREGFATGGGLPADDESTSTIDKALEVPPGDEANLEYSRRATDMVLEYLKEQQDNPDQELLDELGWTEKELGDFLERWQQLKQAVAEGDSGKRELDESLRGLGLRPSRDRVRQGTAANDGASGLRDAGPRTAPPPAYQKLFDAFKKGAARSIR
ncbi:MAG: hypothetical protein H6822_03215 [Planctomycetaceae bacterium]|nr:hypothetical protein [Planctomycetales bacterium]MCB9921163.1 hypothetical protein [Planctomycetaceae bacterium]